MIFGKTLALSALALGAVTAAPNATLDDGIRMLQAPPSNLIPPTDGLRNLVPPRFVSNSISNRAIPTNKWWANMIGYDSIDTIQPVWSNPYAIQVVNTKAPYGFGIMYGYARRFMDGNTGNSGAVKYYGHGLVHEVTLTASEITSNPDVNVVDWTDHGATVQMTSGSRTLETYLVTGMPYVTTKYSGGVTPVVSSAAAILSVNGNSGNAQSGSTFKVQYNSGQTWMVYSLSSDGSSPKDIKFKIDSGTTLVASGNFDGMIRMALVLDDGWVSDYNKYSTCVVTGGSISISSDSSYEFNWDTTGNCNNGMLHFAAPHHEGRLLATKRDGIAIPSTTRGVWQGYTSGTTWKLTEPQAVPEDMVPKSPSSADAASVGLLEKLRDDINAAWSVPKDGSYYFNGKAVLKYASLCLIANDDAVTGGDKGLFNTCIEKLRSVMQPYLENSWAHPLRYDTVYRGIISSQGIATGDINSDFGNTMYNDHHFHYGYWIHTAALINHFDPSWSGIRALNTMTDLLLEDVANFGESETDYPRFRNFDWFRGHSYSHGVTPFGDGKDEESTSEDINFSYAMYLYGKVTGNAEMEKVGKLMTRLNSYAIQTYFLMKDDNVVHPEEFKPNKVTGIFFDNKSDYATWFSAEKYAIHGIQMLPVSAVTPYVRTAQFVREEWDQVLANVNIVASRDKTNPWLSILYLNYASINPDAAIDVLKDAAMDDGLTRSWALYMSLSYKNQARQTSLTDLGLIGL